MSYSDNLDELLISQDELAIVCRTMMEIILDQGLEPLLEDSLKKAQVMPGFAGRSAEIQEKFSHERKRIIARGGIQ